MLLRIGAACLGFEFPSSKKCRIGVRGLSQGFLCWFSLLLFWGCEVSWEEAQRKKYTQAPSQFRQGVKIRVGENSHKKGRCHADSSRRAKQLKLKKTMRRLVTCHRVRFVQHAATSDAALSPEASLERRRRNRSSQAM